MKFTTGSRVKIVGLQSQEGQLLDQKEGFVDHYSQERERYAIKLSGIDELKMIKGKNLLRFENSSDKIFSGEEEMIEHLKRMGMPPTMLKNLTPSQKKTMFEMTQRQSIIEKAKKAAGIDSMETELQDMGGVYSWKDENDKIRIEVNGCDERAVLDCHINHDSIDISIKGEVVLKGPLFQSINAEESKWEVTKDGKLNIVLQKSSNMRWLMVTR
jgi:hypothetical protein